YGKFRGRCSHGGFGWALAGGCFRFRRFAFGRVRAEVPTEFARELAASVDALPVAKQLVRRSVALRRARATAEAVANEQKRYSRSARRIQAGPVGCSNRAFADGSGRASNPLSARWRKQ